MSIERTGFRKMNWLPQRSTWEEMQLARAKRQKMLAEFQQRSQNLINTFANITTAQINGSVDNVAKTASDRIIAEGQAKVDSEYAKLSGGLNKTA